MFGYIVLSSSADKEDKKEYRKSYCGLCHTLREKYGKTGMLSLSYDMTFLSILLEDLLSEKKTEGSERCVMHPLKKHEYNTFPIMDYTSDMQILLSYYSLLDTINDEGKGKEKEKRYSSLIPTIEKKYPRQAEAVKKNLSLIGEYEKENRKDVESLSLIFGSLLGEIFVYDEKSFFKEDLYLLGLNLGAYIYILDAWDDRKKDKKTGAFNPLRDDISEKEVETLLFEKASSAAESYNKLPLDEYTSILNNIIYSGMWTKFNRNRKERDR